MNWINKGYTLRYTGGLVPDVNQIFLKGSGIFSCLSSPSHKEKLRVLYEIAAIAFLIEKAGGKTITRGKGSLMDYVIASYNDKLYLCFDVDHLLLAVPLKFPPWNIFSERIIR